MYKQYWNDVLQSNAHVSKRALRKSTYLTRINIIYYIHSLHRDFYHTACSRNIFLRLFKYSQCRSISQMRIVDLDYIPS
jgi:hypothetical protein